MLVNEPLWPRLNPLFPKANLYALGAQISSLTRIFEAAIVLDVSIDSVVETKCRLTADTLNYLLSMTPSTPRRLEDLLEVETIKDKIAFRIRLDGRDEFNQKTSVGHVFQCLLRPHDESVLILDSYIICRGMTGRKFELEKFHHFVRDLIKMEINYTSELWHKTTLCQEIAYTHHLIITVEAYTYDESKMEVRFNELAHNVPNSRYVH